MVPDSEEDRTEADSPREHACKRFPDVLSAAIYLRRATDTPQLLVKHVGGLYLPSDIKDLVERAEVSQSAFSTTTTRANASKQLARLRGRRASLFPCLGSESSAV
ncbi:uncharacterized protein UDID_16797 [Ustilago sp. UG-2017a]|nr:uncharacterized protein UDID_16797 [Ustilago sp. UG-2017a]